jgi:hypothetical protein
VYRRVYNLLYCFKIKQGLQGSLARQGRLLSFDCALLVITDVDNWKKLTNYRNRVRKKSFGGTFCFSNCHIIGTGGLVFLVSGTW